MTDIDISGAEAGEKVDVPEIDTWWKLDGYTPTNYAVGYNFNEETGYYDAFMQVFGTSFVMPETDGPVALFASVVKGEARSVSALQSVNSDGKVFFDIPEGTFEDTTILNIDIINPGDDNFDMFESADGEDGWTILERAEGALSEITTSNVIFELSALCFNEYIQPNKKILVTFPIPEDFDSDCLALYYVDTDGKIEKIPVEIDKENGVCRVYIYHFSTYVLASNVEANESDNGHFVHILTLVPENKPSSCTETGNKAYYTCSGCDKYFADDAGENEITDKASVTLTGDHSFTVPEKDATHHWNKCESCTETDEKQPHSYGDDGKCACGATKPASDTPVKPSPDTSDTASGIIFTVITALALAGLSLASKRRREN